MTGDGGSPAHDALEAEVLAAEALCAQGQWCRALDRFSDIVRERLAAQKDGAAAAFTAADAVVIGRLAELSVVCGFDRAASDLLAACRSLYLRAGNRLAADDIALKETHLAISRGEFAWAEELLESLSFSTVPPDEIGCTAEGPRAWENTCHLDGVTGEGRAYFFAQFLLGLGRLLAAQGQYRDALGAFARGLHHADGNPAAPAAAARLPLRVERAAALLESGALDEARREIDALGDGFAAAPHPGAAVRLRQLGGQLCLLRGELGKARHEFEGVAAECQRLGLERAGAFASLQLAQVYIFLNRTTDARGLLAGLLAKASRYGSESLAARAAHLFVVAGARGGMRETETAVDGRTAGAPLPTPGAINLPQAPNYLDFFEDRALGFHALLDAGDYPAARDWLQEMRQVFELSDSRLIALRLDVLDALDAYFMGQTQAASRRCAALRPRLRQLGLKRDEWQVAQLARWCEARLLPAGRAPDPGVREEAERLLDELSRSLPPGESAVYLLNKATVEEEGFVARLDELVAARDRARGLGGPRRWLAAWRVARDVHHFQARLDAHRDTLVHRRLSPGADRQPACVPRRGFWRSLGWRSPFRATISFLVLPDRLLVVRAGWMVLRFEVWPVPRLHLREGVRACHEAMENGRSDAAIAEARELSARIGLDRALRELPCWVRAISIIPDDCLHGFPFAIPLRHARRPGGYASHVGFERIVSPRARWPHGRGALVVTCSAGAGNLPALPNARSEGEETVRWLERQRVPAQFLSGPEARKAAVLLGLPAVGFAHLACHGEFSADEIGRTGLALIPTTGRKELLTLQELAGLDLRGLGHITLSSCSLADNYTFPGRWIVSLPETLCRAGANLVLACLWKVDDDMGKLFARHFYEHARRHSPEEALRLTQEAFQTNALSDKPRSTDSAFHWAGYTLYASTEEYRPRWPTRAWKKAMRMQKTAGPPGKPNSEIDRV